MWGKNSLDIKFPGDTERICATPGGAEVFGGDPEPIKLTNEERTEADTVYNEWGLSIDAYEQSVQVSNFTSKFDAFLKNQYTMTPDEMAGFNLFNGKGNCNSCHVDGRGTTLQPGQVDTSTTATANPPLLSDHAGSLWVHRESIRFRLQRFGNGNFPAKWFRLRPQPKPELDTICTRC
jgi:cytochrome c peroxidase